MIVTPDNIFIGAKVKLNDEIFTVVKVNAKSFYCTTLSLSDFNEKFAKRLPGVTFTKFCKMENILSRKYSDNFEIEEAEFNRKEVATSNVDNKYKIKKADKIATIDFIKDMKKRKRSIKFQQFGVGDRLVRFLEENNGCYLISFNGDYVLCSFETDEFVKIGTVLDYKFKEVPWNKLSVFSSEGIKLTA